MLKCFNFGAVWWWKEMFLWLSWSFSFDWKTTTYNHKRKEKKRITTKCTEARHRKLKERQKENWKWSNACLSAVFQGLCAPQRPWAAFKMHYILGLQSLPNAACVRMQGHLKTFLCFPNGLKEVRLPYLHFANALPQLVFPHNIVDSHLALRSFALFIY